MAIFFSGKRDVYLEIAERYEKYIKAGVLNDGDKLPSVRVAAEELGVNPNTVQKAYALLENNGFIYSLPKKGAFVCYNNGKEANASKNRLFAMEAINSIKALGVGKEELKLLIDEVYSDD